MNLSRYDVVVVGGSYAGMAAALQLLRARRTVLVIDAGQRRNQAAAESHGFLGQDGVDPAEIARMAREQLHRYPTLTWIDGRVVSAGGSRDDFAISCEDGSRYRARRVLLAIGVSDELPPVPGLAQRWGTSVFHCPYCHGYELDRGRIGVIAAGQESIHQARLLLEWGEVTFLTNGLVELDATMRQDLLARGMAIESAAIAAIEGHSDVVLADGRRIGFDGLFTAPRNKPSTPIAEQLGCELVETPFGVQIGTGSDKQTSVQGVYACGDAARVPHSVSLSVGDGAWAGMQLHQSLVSAPVRPAS